MTKIEPPKTKEELLKVRESILDLMGNPFCDHLMFMDLLDKREAVDKKIEELENESDE